MTEPLSEVIRIRVTPSHAARLGEAAALSGLSLSNDAQPETHRHEKTRRTNVHAGFDQFGGASARPELYR